MSVIQRTIFRARSSFRPQRISARLLQSRFLPMLLLFGFLLIGSGCHGIRPSVFITPVYRIPPGYSETYRQRLLETEPLTQPQIISQQKQKEER